MLAEQGQALAHWPDAWEQTSQGKWNDLNIPRPLKIDVNLAGEVKPNTGKLRGNSLPQLGQVRGRPPIVPPGAHASSVP